MSGCHVNSHISTIHTSHWYFCASSQKCAILLIRNCYNHRLKLSRILKWKKNSSWPLADGQDGFWGKAPKIFGTDTEINIDSSHTTSMIVQVQENMLSEWVFAESFKCQDDATHHISALALNQRCHINFWQDFKCFSDETQGLVACSNIAGTFYQDWCQWCCISWLCVLSQDFWWDCAFQSLSICLSLLHQTVWWLGGCATGSASQNYLSWQTLTVSLSRMVFQCWWQ